MEDFRHYRRICKVTQRDIAKLCGVSVWKLSLAECGQLALTSQEEAAIREALRKHLETLAIKATEASNRLSKEAAK